MDAADRILFLKHSSEFRAVEHHTPQHLSAVLLRESPIRRTLLALCCRCSGGTSIGWSYRL